jgi:hypothetical protein
MIANINNVITLTKKELEEAILGYIYKRNPNIRPMGTKDVAAPEIFINNGFTNQMVRVNETIDDDYDADMVMAILPNVSEECCDDKKRAGK